MFAAKDRTSAEILKNIFGGNLYNHPEKKFTRWMIQDIKSVYNILNLINGKLRTPNINAVYDMIYFF